jgi:hypothetical protein
MDDWQFVPLLERAMNGTLTFKELWAPHDEHRLLLPRLIIIASMFATHGDYRVQCFITFAVVAIISACLLWLMVRPLAAKYLLTETPSSNYLQRNRMERSRFGRQRYLLDRAGTDRWLKENYRFRDQT